jgi:hypothetical protein
MKGGQDETCPPDRSHDCSAAAEQTNDEQDDREHQQNVHERTDRVRADDSQDPRDQQNDG